MLTLPQMAVWVNGEIGSVDALHTDADTLLTFTRASVAGKSVENMRCQVASTPFSMGGIRAAFHALVRTRAP